ncbi:MAG: type I methionyl aminopeptidase [bacterium]|nr:type I methionyl aminopeptidase [bacterium]
MIRLKTEKEIDILREGGSRLAELLRDLSVAAVSKVSANSLNRIAEEKIKNLGDEGAFLNYKPNGAARAFPASVCVSVNDAVVHGIPNEKEIVLAEGDVVSLDCGLCHRGMITDMAVTVLVTYDREITNKKRQPDEDKKIELIKVTRDALAQGIKEARPGNTVGDIGAAIENFVKPFGFGIVRDLAGHGVGYKVHEEPFVPNYGQSGKGERLLPGMVLAIEPMFTLGKGDVCLDEDGFTYRTKDGAIAAHFEQTIAITSKGPEILTPFLGV